MILRLLPALLLLAACEDVTVEPAVDRITTPIAQPSFRSDIAPILDVTCASSGACHGGAAPARGLDLSAGAAYGDLVDVPSQYAPQLMRVRPGLPDSSFALLVLSDDPAVRLGYYRMPLTRYPMPAPVVQTIRNWIANGAPDN